MSHRLTPTVVRAIGQILAVSYPVLALSAGTRAVYQLFFKPGVTDKFPPALSAVAALLYLLATLGFVLRKPWAWWLAVGILTLETAGVLLVGTLSLLEPGVIGRTVWHDYGIDYGFLPLIQPILGLIWLMWPENRRAFFLDQPRLSQGRG
ncbi:hypothetical protein [Meiothermus granaticius]|uniref:Integral membrane protein n=1 Tax=Meiothermus granaticius NBRC 107808 TaxID=1227551 RepID=A0A399FEZ4_9DEIN|nr:hypothetical protein [Meiothermus granaticius]RIH93762.1 hypothetical protein Mgrana_00345 [Meiothermus granaticius NBRC 107808]GEM85715.1 hypothetical protein MGR01S_03400 [Meiothermus granaticius NBRC 107808]